jgi:hypothetical protein
VVKNPTRANAQSYGIFAVSSTPADPKPPDASELCDLDHAHRRDPLACRAPHHQHPNNPGSPFRDSLRAGEKAT